MNSCNNNTHFHLYIIHPKEIACLYNGCIVGNNWDSIVWSSEKCSVDTCVLTCEKKLSLHNVKKKKEICCNNNMHLRIVYITHTYLSINVYITHILVYNT